MPMQLGPPSLHIRLARILTAAGMGHLRKSSFLSSREKIFTALDLQHLSTLVDLIYFELLAVNFLILQTLH